MAVNENKDFYDFDNYVTKLEEINKPKTVAILNNYSVFHSLIKTNVFNLPAELLAFTFDSRYSSKTFQGIMPNSEAAGVSTAGQPQFTALQKLDPSLQINAITAGQHNIRFGKGKALSQGTIDVTTPLGTNYLSHYPSKYTLSILPSRYRQNESQTRQPSKCAYSRREDCPDRT
jgi:hypothetical protein